MPSAPTNGERFMRGLTRLLARVFFRRLEVAGAEHIPDDQPVLLVANHVNGLVDALVLMATLDRFPRFLAKATLFKIVPIVPLLKLARVIPVHRASDRKSSDAAGSLRDQNQSAFRTCREILGAGGVVAIFPEGISHDEPSLQPLKTGAARIVLEATVDDGTSDITVVPIGLVYEDKARFRSRALVRVGTPIPVDRDAATVEALTATIDDGLRAVGPDFSSWDEARLWSRVAGIATGRSHADLEERDGVARSLAAFAAGHPEDPVVVELRASVERYEQDLAVLGLSDRQLLAGAEGGTPSAALGRSIRQAAVAAPAVAVGLAIHALPYSLMKQIAKLPKNEGMKATVKVLGCLGLFSVVYLSLAVVVSRRRGLLAGAVALVTGPVTGWVTLRTAERLYAAGGLAEAGSVLRRTTGIDAVLAHRADVVRLCTLAGHAAG